MSFFGDFYSELADKAGDVIDTGVGALAGGGAALGCALAFPPAAVVTAPVCGFVGAYLGEKGSGAVRRATSHKVRDWIASGRQGPPPPGAELLSSAPVGDVASSRGPRGNVELEELLAEPAAAGMGVWSTLMLALVVAAVAAAAALYFGAM